MEVKERTADRPSPATGIDSRGVRCWCGAEDLEPFRSDYSRCRDCGTVVYSESIDPEDYTAGDGTGFYGDRYWRRHVPGVLGLPGLEERARSDLAERAVFHLVKILDYLRGSRVLELGCGAGSLTYLLRQAGFDATGLELGPAAVELARRRFGVEVHHGLLETLEDQGPYDAIVAVDVLEHLADPSATMTLCARRLTAEGVLFLQTPCYRQDGPDWQMLLPEEHLHLFTESSVEMLLREAGFAAVDVGPSIFPHDMWVVASRGASLIERSEPSADVPPVVVALIDAFAESTRVRDERDAIDADRRCKQEAADKLTRDLESTRGDQAAKAELIERLTSELETVRGDQAGKAELIERLIAELETVRGDQAVKAELIERLTSELETVRGDQAVKAELIERLTSELETVRGDQAAKAELIERLTSELEAVRGDQAAKAELIDRTDAELTAVRADQAAKEELVERLTSELESVRGDQHDKELLIRQLAEELDAGAAELGHVRAELEKIHSDRLFRFLNATRTRLGGRR